MISELTIILILATAIIGCLLVALWSDKHRGGINA